MNYQEKLNSEKIQRVKIRPSLKTNDIGLSISNNSLYFNFTKSCWKTLETINVSNLRQKKVDIALASYVMKLLKFTYL